MPEVKEGALHKQLKRSKSYRFTDSELRRMSKVKTGNYFSYPTFAEKRKMTLLLKKRVVFALNFR
jgi:hypothetical protein